MWWSGGGATAKRGRGEPGSPAAAGANLPPLSKGGGQAKRGRRDCLVTGCRFFKLQLVVNGFRCHGYFFETAFGHKTIPPSRPAAVPPPFDKGGKEVAATEQAPLSKGAGCGPSPQTGGLPKKQQPFLEVAFHDREISPSRRFFKTASGRKTIPPSRPAAVPPPFDKGG